MFLSGPITAKNGLTIQQNIERMREYSSKLDNSDVVVIDPSLPGNLEDLGYSNADAMYVWKSLLSSGRIGKIALIPGWEKSNGSTEEREAALKHGLTLIYL